jgi:hypothetical protein
MTQRQRLVAVVAEHLEILGQAGLADRGEVGVAGTDAGDGQRIGGSDLPGRRGRRRSRTVSAPGTSRTSTPWSARKRARRRRGWRHLDPDPADRAVAGNQLASWR